MKGFGTLGVIAITAAIIGGIIALTPPFRISAETIITGKPVLCELAPLNSDCRCPIPWEKVQTNPMSYRCKSPTEGMNITITLTQPLRNAVHSGNVPISWEADGIEYFTVAVSLDGGDTWCAVATVKKGYVSTKEFVWDSINQCSTLFVSGEGYIKIDYTDEAIIRITDATNHNIAGFSEYFTIDNT